MDTNYRFRHKILLVEDDEAIGKSIRWQLKKYFEIDLASDGKEALELYSQNDYHLILTDINLGIGKNGIDIMKEIRSTDKGERLTIIAITAYANFGDRESFLSAGFDDYLSKPFEIDELLRCIMDAISIYND